MTGQEQPSEAAQAEDIARRLGLPRVAQHLGRLVEAIEVRGELIQMTGPQARVVHLRSCLKTVDPDVDAGFSAAYQH